MQAAQSLCKIVENSLVVFCCAFLGHKTIYKASQWHRASEIKGSKPVTAVNRAANAVIAQKVEHMIFNLGVVGSIPTGGTINQRE